jgi:hypothetical protein
MENSGNEIRSPAPKKKWSFKKRVIVASMLALTSIGVASAAAPKDGPQPAPTPGIQDPQSSTPKIETKQTTETEDLPFKTNSQDDASLPSGQIVVAQEGKNGSKTTTYELTYADGVQTNKKPIGDPVVVNPTDKIVKNGTYVAPSQPSHPPGASAMCSDGTYSYSAHRQGTCSHHGGVAIWY